MDRQGFLVALHKNIEMANSKEDEVVYKVDALIDEVIKVQEMNPEKAKEYLVSLSKSISFRCILFSSSSQSAHFL